MTGVVIPLGEYRLRRAWNALHAVAAERGARRERIATLTDRPDDFAVAPLFVGNGDDDTFHFGDLGSPSDSPYNGDAA